MTPQRIYTIVAMLSVSAANADELVDRADANGDGFVSLYELRAAHYADVEFNQRIEKSFAEYDTDGDGLISEAELSAQRAEPVEPEANAATPAIAATAATAAAAITAPTPVTPAPAPVTAATPAAAATATTTATAPTTVTSAPAATAAAAGTAAIVSTDTPDVDTAALDSREPESDVSTATTAAAASLPSAGGLSRAEIWIREIDRDNSGGASINELVASGDGSQWFTKKTFESADADGDGDLNPDELEVLLQSLERRRR